MTLRILYVWDAEYPWDVRTEKICRALTEAGHQVVITARNRRGDARREVRPEGVVERLPAGPRILRHAWSFPAFVNPVWLAHLGRLIRRHAIALVVVRDLPLAPTALMAARGGMPVMLDMAENYPAMIQDIWTDGRQRPLDVLVRNPRIVAAVERWVVRRMAHVLTVVEESRRRIVELGVAEHRVSVVSNTPPRTRIATLSPERRDPPVRLIYLGLLERHRGIGCTLEAAALLQQAGVSFHLDIVGGGRDAALFRNQADALNLTASSVTFHGQVQHHEALDLVSRAHIGLVPHLATASWNTTIPNKLFDYMAAGLAVVSSDAIPAARVVRETGAGVVFRSGDPHDMAARLRDCCDEAAWDRFRRAGQAAIQSRYHWEADTQVLCDVVARVGRASSSPPPGPPSS